MELICAACTVCFGTPASVISFIYETCESREDFKSVTPHGTLRWNVNISLWIILRRSWPPLPVWSPAVRGSRYRKIRNKKTNSAAAAGWKHLLLTHSHTDVLRAVSSQSDWAEPAIVLTVDRCLILPQHIYIYSGFCSSFYF